MHCPFCSHKDSRVTDSRLGAEGMEVRRRRECPECEIRFTTYEKIERRYPRVLKKNNNLEVFIANKIRSGIQRSVEKRPVSSSSVEAMVERVCDALSRIGEEQVSSEIIGNMVLKELATVDDVAYVRFASVYQRFESIRDFTQALERISLKNIE